MYELSSIAFICSAAGAAPAANDGVSLDMICT